MQVTKIIIMHIWIVCSVLLFSVKPLVMMTFGFNVSFFLYNLTSFIIWLKTKKCHLICLNFASRTHRTIRCWRRIIYSFAPSTWFNAKSSFFAQFKNLYKKKDFDAVSYLILMNDDILHSVDLAWRLLYWVSNNKYRENFLIQY